MRFASTLASAQIIRCTSCAAPHLQTEDRDGLLGPDADILRDVQGERGLTDRRTGRHDNQVRALEAGRHLVEINETRRNSRRPALIRVELLHLLEYFHQHIANDDEAAELRRCEISRISASASLSIDPTSSSAGIAIGDDLGRCPDQAAQHRLLLDDLRVIVDVRRCRHRIGQLR